MQRHDSNRRARLRSVRHDKDERKALVARDDDARITGLSGARQTHDLGPCLLSDAKAHERQARAEETVRLRLELQRNDVRAVAKKPRRTDERPIYQPPDCFGLGRPRRDLLAWLKVCQSPWRVQRRCQHRLETEDRGNVDRVCGRWREEHRFRRNHCGHSDRGLEAHWSAAAQRCGGRGFFERQKVRDAARKIRLFYRIDIVLHHAEQPRAVGGPDAEEALAPRDDHRGRTPQPGLAVNREDNDVAGTAKHGGRNPIAKRRYRNVPERVPVLIRKERNHRQPGAQRLQCLALVGQLANVNSGVVHGTAKLR
eukprot:Amastigsp_a175743_247.p2 type:complete len:311 gc:universal Amastigsp_a175743_247:397-1329(+)